MLFLKDRSNKNTNKAYIFGIFIFLFLFFQLPFFNSLEIKFFSLNVAEAQCVADVPVVPTGGIVPCGRLADNPDTPYDEMEPCGLCHVFLVLQIISTFIIEIGGGLAVLFLVIGGLLYATSAGNSYRSETGRHAIVYALVGLAITVLAWLIITIILAIFGYIEPFGGKWNVMENCTFAPGGSTPPTVLPYCGDGIVNSDEVCDWASTPSQNCMTTLDGIAPAYCGSVVVPGTQACNCDCKWDTCVASAPILVETNYGYDVCNNGSIALNGYKCCELYNCTGDQCCGGSSGTSFSLPGGYVELNSIPFSSGYCKLGQSSTVPTDWYIGTSHTNASFRCW